ncbi:MAG: tRNA uridine-5-carboxymethylaminomethyl(34) synthesis GTPase MnmE [Bacillota bacterium]
MSDIIVAPATSVATSGAVGIVRLSGEGALDIASKVFSSKELDFANITPRTLYLGKLSTNNFNDKAFCVFYKAPKSYTGEDMIEFHTHGGTAIMQGVIRKLVALGARPAHAGEFTKRAFLNNKMSLDEAEGVADIISAESEAQINQAYRMISGDISRGINAICDMLLTASANLEVVLDYPEELGEDTQTPTYDIINEALAKIKALLNGASNRRYIQQGITIALAGLPNVGKSSLMNALLNDERAIVTEIAGTTRDTLREHMEIEGVKVNLIDTAGIRQSDDVVEKIGIDRAKSAIDSADLVLFIADLTQPFSAEEERILQDTAHKPRIIIGNKCDNMQFERTVDIQISAKNMINITELVSIITQKVDIAAASSGAVITRDRHIHSLQVAEKSLEEALAHFGVITLDCTIVDLKTAYRALCDITGYDVDESVVEEIFSKFCVGK